MTFTERANAFVGWVSTETRSMFKKTLVALAVFLATQTSSVQAHTKVEPTKAQAEKSSIEKIEVRGVRQRLEKAGMLSDSIMKTEVISSELMDNKNAVNLTEAINNTPGVRVSNECSMCGVKRIMLNGLRGEQTTILVDGLPVHAMIAGYYAVDAIPTTGLDRIEVARGAGASLIAPEAIGGTINIITKTATENGAALDVSMGENGNRKIGILGTGVSEDERTRATLIAQYDSREQADEDNNKVNEAPSQDNRTFTVRVSHDLTERDNLVLRYSNVNSEIFGGPMLGETFADGKADSIGDVLSSFDNIASDVIFEGGDVRNKFIGKAWETTEWIHTQRDELSLSWLRELNDNWNMTLSGSYSDHIQDSFYEGFRYYAEDKMLYLDARFNYFLNDNHLLTFGSDRRTEEMRSSSSGEGNPNYVSDSFDYDVQGFYLQDTWQATDDLEINMALRYDHVQADFIDPKKPGKEIDKSILAPRIDMRYNHNDSWTSRLSAGRGYRAPLSFFETDHGVLDASLGFDIDIQELERSTSATYALSYSADQLTATTSFAWTQVENLAMLSETADGVPLLTQLQGDARVTTADLALGYDITDDLTLNFTAEGFFYDDAFKSSYSLAPIEQRLTLNADWNVHGWDLFANLVWIGGRDLSEYGYEGYNQVDVNGDVIASSKKSTDAPSYWTLDLKITKSLTDNVDFYAGVNNLLDYTQVNEGETPLFFDADGGYDVAYIWGPLRGREIYAGVKAHF
ncbi:TonB-dependent receptor [Shewanella sp. D64]|uniref:TonB-dependent receptor plug domain-containing protein n=1 Tax=unclassified Shewanella TaxID=196818 RepID=UPI0022BA2A64|nr:MULTISPECIES: TonB-dependent receptor [unclassified Shewanella]MEC4726129.1 TonB-dependent receptor [Shewanella sp. D64]MEC4737955.1 TonB-dependent receptor [Shewanella sp. E94]WBJ96155.1 TonB-dependent receptor [Shewanella sp. MTB7]